MNLTSKRKSIFLIVTLIVLGLDLTFVVINYFSSKTALNSSLMKNAQAHKEAFNVSFSMINNNMLQMSTLMAKNKVLNQIFLRGKKAVEEEGGGAGKKKADKARKELLRIIKTGWNEMMKKFDVRQLHYHLGPGSVSFLRVHMPNKFGDHMNNVRHTIVDTNKEKVSRTGFETGRVYSGLRGVTPVWAIDPESKQKVYVGALEVGTSFSTLFSILDRQLDVGFSAILTKEHVEQNMWEESIKKRFGNQSLNCDCYIEASSRLNITSILPYVNIRESFSLHQPKIIHMNNTYLSLFYFPLRDYRATKHPDLPPVGVIILWDDITSLIEAFRSNIKINILYAFIGFFIVEFAILFAIKVSIKQFQSIVNERTKELRIANQQKDKLFSIIAHDLRNPFMPILGYADLIGKSTGNLTRDDIRGYANKIWIFGKRVINLLETLLDWSRLQLNEFKASPESLDLSEAILPILDLFVPLASNKNITLRNNITSIEVYTDKNMIDTVIRNLVDNAIKFTPLGGTVTLSIHKGEDEVIVLVSDTGIGITKEQLDKIMKRDDYSSSNGTQGEKGTGLGLSVCADLINKCGGKFYAKSTQVDGTTFYFTLKRYSKKRLLAA